jgi:hypothetical protein
VLALAPGRRHEAIAVLLVAFAAATSIAAPTDRREAWKLLNERDFATLDPAFDEVQRQYETRFREVQDRRENAFAHVSHVLWADESAGPLYDAWVKAYPKSYAASLARGEYLVALA